MVSKVFCNSCILSKHRSSLYGIASVMILCVHSCKFLGTGDIITKLAFSILKFGSLGVPIFGFLGGVGLYFSLIKQPLLSSFYVKRFKRVFLPYLCIASIWYSYEFLITKFDIISFFLDVSTISFWTHHRSMWYIAMLVPVYLISPLYSRWLEKGKRGLKTVLSIMMVFLLMAIVYHFDPLLHQHLHLVFRTLAVMLCGYYLGEKIYLKNTMSIHWIIIPIFVFAIYKFLIKLFHLPEYEPLWSLSFAFLALPLTVILSVIFEHAGNEVASMRSFGAVSLESYVWNQVLIKFQLVLSSKINFCASHQLLIYVLMVPLSILFSYATYNLFQDKNTRKVIKSYPKE